MGVASEAVERLINHLQDQVADPHHDEEEMRSYRELLTIAVRELVGNSTSFLTYREIQTAVHRGIRESFSNQTEWEQYAGYALEALGR